MPAQLASDELYNNYYAGIAISPSGALYSVGTEGSEVGAGDTVTIAPGIAHKLSNPGAEPLVLLCCCSPPYSHEDTILFE